MRCVQVFVKAAKYGLVDPSKEMVYIGVSRELQKRGKGVVDMLGQVLGKSGGAWLVQVRSPTLLCAAGV